MDRSDLKDLALDVSGARAEMLSVSHENASLRAEIMAVNVGGKCFVVRNPRVLFAKKKKKKKVDFELFLFYKYYNLLPPNSCVSEVKPMERSCFLKLFHNFTPPPKSHL